MDYARVLNEVSNTSMSTPKMSLNDCSLFCKKLQASLSFQRTVQKDSKLFDIKSALSEIAGIKGSEQGSSTKTVI
jgi:hypothetical protein